MLESYVKSTLYHGAKSRVRVDCELSEKFQAKVGMHRGSELSSFFHSSCGRCCS